MQTDELDASTLWQHPRVANERLTRTREQRQMAVIAAEEYDRIACRIITRQGHHQNGDQAARQLHIIIVLDMLSSI